MGCTRYKGFSQFGREDLQYSINSMTEIANTGVKYCLALYDDSDLTDVFFSIDVSDDEISICELSSRECGLPYHLPHQITLTREHELTCPIGKLYKDNSTMVQVIETPIEIVLLYRDSDNGLASKIVVFRKVSEIRGSRFA